MRKSIFASLLIAAAFGSSALAADPIRLENGRFLINGSPRFILGVYDSGLGYSNNPEFYETRIFSPAGPRGLRDIPLNFYLNYHYGEAPIDAIQALMTTLQKHGILYWQTGNCFEDKSYKRIPFKILDDGYVRAFGEHPGAGGYYTMDECSDPLHGEIKELNERLHRLDPNGTTFLTLLARAFRDPRVWIDAGDIIATDPYPMYGAEPAAGYTHYDVADYIARLRAAVPKERPVVAVLQFFKFTNDSRLPTYQEMKSHAVMSIVEGAQGLVWWELGSGGLGKTPDLRAGGMANLGRLVKELASLETALVATDAPQALKGNSTSKNNPIEWRKEALKHNIAVEWLFSDKTWFQAELKALESGDQSKSYMLDQSGNIRTRVKIANGKGYIFAYNYTNRRLDATFRWQNSVSSVLVSDEGRTLAAAGDSFSDTFGPYQAHIYIVSEGGNVPSPTPTPAPQPIPSPTPTPSPTPQTPPISQPPIIPFPPAPSFIFTKPLYRGLRSGDVLALQTILISKEFLASGLTTGYFGPLTEEAVRKFQCSHNIVCSGTPASTGWGFVGPKTRASLNSL